ncbi:PDGLE domain-containing protein [Methanoregula sp.]|uniref:PDGLE domain-containing protein n=1 Tax=Methanoregula sp. TaxID=2052170 RepID=UPI00236DDE33|nr:PDGLE domain-containing protein [Methanoregula sp.]MDD1685818.1 PDGLE domain-containing protein [Methanoregula sp.]
MMDNKTFLIAGIIVALLIGGVAVFMASGDPDGLESTALVVQGQKDLTGATPLDAEIHEEEAGRFAYSAPMPDYSLGESLGSTGGLVAIIVGTILAFLVVFGLAYGLKKASKPVK